VDANSLYPLEHENFRNFLQLGIEEGGQFSLNINKNFSVNKLYKMEEKVGKSGRSAENYLTNPFSQGGSGSGGAGINWPPGSGSVILNYGWRDPDPQEIYYFSYSSQG
jgi:hypothetical protein